METETLTIGKVAGRTGVGIETIRFYEREKLIDPPPRSEAGYRLYPVTTVQRLRFIRRAKKLGFTLKEIKELLVLQEDPDSTCGDIMARAEQKLFDINQRINDLKKMRDALKILTDSCSSDATSAECPIMQAITEE
jgi:Hg(II)-responsive transcriptional regulator